MSANISIFVKIVNNHTMENIFAARVVAVRAMMRERGWDAVILTGSDPHASEYPARRWKQVE